MMTTRQSTIDLSALRANFERVRAKAPTSFVLSMIKADAYGHGLVTVARALTASHAFGVATLSAAIKLREAGLTQLIVLMTGFSTQEELRLIAHHRIATVIHSVHQIELLERHKISVPVWLKVSVNMNRLGFPLKDVVAIHRRLSACCPAQTPIPLMMHFASTDTRGGHYGQEALRLFNSAVNCLGPVPRSIAHSAGIFACPESHADWVRPGICLYGVSPFANSVGCDYGLRPVMTLSAALIAVRQLKRGDPVGYGGTWRSPCAKRIGVVAMGYGDGYPRAVPSGTPVLIDGIVCPIVGRVSMDMMTVDLTHCPQADIGSRAVLWGEGLPVERIAEAAGTIPYELLCSVTARVQKRER